MVKQTLYPLEVELEQVLEDLAAVKKHKKQLQGDPKRKMPPMKTSTNFHGCHFLGHPVNISCQLEKTVVEARTEVTRKIDLKGIFADLEKLDDAPLATKVSSLNNFVFHLSNRLTR